LVNIGIGKLLENKKENEELQRYLAERSYESASLGETSADELAIVNNSLSNGELEVYRDSAISHKYEEAKAISS